MLIPFKETIIKCYAIQTFITRK